MVRDWFKNGIYALLLLSIAFFCFVFIDPLQSVVCEPLDRFGMDRMEACYDFFQLRIRGN